MLRCTKKLRTHALRAYNWRTLVRDWLSYSYSVVITYTATVHTTVTDHGESDIGSLERRSVVGSVAGDGHDLARRVEMTGDDSVHEDVLVLRRSARQHAQGRPDPVKLRLYHLRKRKYQSCSKYCVIKYKYKYKRCKCKYQYQYMKYKYKYRRSKYQ